MLRIFAHANYNFIGNRNKAFVFTGVCLLVTIISIIYHKGLNYSIDFTGGTMVQLKFQNPVMGDLGRIRSIVNGLGLGSPEVKTIGQEKDNEIQIIVKKQSEEDLVSQEIATALSKGYGENGFEIRKEEKVGPKVGGELKKGALISLLLSLAAIIIYVGMRFNFPFGVAAVLCLFHDALVTIGLFSVLNIELSLSMIAALMTIIGYSLNDTIVVFDRIRENMGGTMHKQSFEDKVNQSINQTISRTIITSVTTLLAIGTVLVIFFSSRDVVSDFALAMTFGTVMGTYSTIFIASPIVVLWNRRWPIK